MGGLDWNSGILISAIEATLKEVTKLKGAVRAVESGTVPEDTGNGIRTRLED